MKNLNVMFQKLKTGFNRGGKNLNVGFVKHKVKACGTLMVALVMALMPVASVTALSAADISSFSQNDILFYDPTGGCVASSENFRAGDGISAAYGLSATQISFVETYHDIAVRYSINYGIPWETVVAQGILESASGTSAFARERNNFFGIGAFDSNPDNAFSYATPEEGWEGYYKNIQNTATYKEHGVFQGDTVTDPYAYLRAIKEAGYATASNYVESVSKIIAAIEKLAQERGWPLSGELAKTYPEWIQNAEANAEGGASGAGFNILPFCTEGGGALVSGGMTLAEAENFMKAYATEAAKKLKGTQVFQGATINDGGCTNGALNNCSAFTQWFLNRYTTIGPNGAILYQGSESVRHNLSAHPELIDGGKVPRLYAVMSQGPKSGCQDGFCNHTGIVLGIDEANNTIIIGSAHCYGGVPDAKVFKLSEYTNNSSPYGPTYAYTDNVLKMEAESVSE